MIELDLSAAVFGVWRGDKQIASGALGGSPLGVPAAPDMQVRVGQPMEPMLSTVLLQLNREGFARLDEPIAKWVPDFPRADQITPRMLANGTTGISDYVTDPVFLKTFYANPIKGFTSQELFDLANARPPLFAPGSSFSYAHSDLVVLGVVLEKATGKSLGNLIQQRVLDPLGMKQSRVMLTPQMVEPSLHGSTGTTLPATQLDRRGQADRAGACDEYGGLIHPTSPSCHRPGVVASVVLVGLAPVVATSFPGRASAP